jgi:hypothetical protein
MTPRHASIMKLLPRHADEAGNNFMIDGGGRGGAA